MLPRRLPSCCPIAFTLAALVPHRYVHFPQLSDTLTPHSITLSLPPSPLSPLLFSGASYNYLYGPVPKLGTALKTIDVQKNWLSGTFPGTGFLSCSASSNCLASSGACNTTGTTQCPLASCAVCDSPKGTDPICAGGTCAPNTAGPLATSTTPTATSPILPRFCMGVPLDAVQASILLSVKTALGVTLTQWSASTLGMTSKANPLSSEFRNRPSRWGGGAWEGTGRAGTGFCRWFQGRRACARFKARRPSPAPGRACSALLPAWSLASRVCYALPIAVLKTATLTSPAAVSASAAASAADPSTSAAPPASSAPYTSAAPSAPAVQSPLCLVGRELRSFLPRGTVHADISKLTTLTALYLSSNLFLQRLDSFVAPILPTVSIKDLAVSFNWFYGSVPAKLVTMAALSNLRLSYNYLTGSLPKPGATLKFIDTQANFLSGTFPTATLACNTRLNCFSNASGCVNVDETEQRTAVECSICGSPQTQQGLCGGGTCLPVLPPSLAKVPNSAAAPLLVMTCAAVPLDANSGAALGVRDTDWCNGSKCNIEGQSANPKSWPGVWCSANGTVLNITLPNKALRGIIHADISKLTALSYL
ncbi:unnamed protein product [Closterium sp. Naga37s-1]|nr:unnamed protein product [Closterium sp. Naga37s-1]